MINNSEELKLGLIREFRDQLVSFLDDLIEAFPAESDLIIIRICVKDQLPMADVLGRYIRDLLPIAKQIKDRNAGFFLQNTLLYSGAPLATAKINHFKDLWQSDQLDDNDRDTIWKWMDVLNAVASRYLKQFGHIKGWEPKE